MARLEAPAAEPRTNASRDRSISICVEGGLLVESVVPAEKTVGWVGSVTIAIAIRTRLKVVLRLPDRWLISGTRDVLYCSTLCILLGCN